MAAVGRLLALAHPGVEGGHQPALRPGVVERVARKLAAAVARRQRARAVPRAGDVVDAHVGRVGQIGRAVHRRVAQRPEPALVPVLGPGVEGEDLRLEAGRDARAQAVALAGDRIGRHLVQEGELRFGEHAERVQQREALVEAGQARAAGLDERGVEHLAPLLVDGEAVVDDLADGAAGLRRSVHVGEPARRDDARLVLHRRGHVADRGEADAGHRRILRLERHLVGEAGGEAALERHELRVGDVAAVDDAAELPVGARHQPPRREHAFARGQPVGGVVHVDGEIALGRVAGRPVHRVGRLVEQEPLAHPALDRLSVVARDRRLDPDQRLGHVELPADGDQREALLEQRGVAEVRAPQSGRRRRGASLNVVSRRNRPAVDDVEEDHPVAAGRILGLEDEDIGRELDLAVAVPRRHPEVGDDLVARMRGVDGEVGGAPDLLVRPGGAERLAAEHVDPRLDVDADEFGEAWGRHPGEHQPDPDHDGCHAPGRLHRPLPVIGSR